MLRPRRLVQRQAAVRVRSAGFAWRECPLGRRPCSAFGDVVDAEDDDAVVVFVDLQRLIDQVRAGLQPVECALKQCPLASQAGVKAAFSSWPLLSPDGRITASPAPSHSR